MNIAIEDVAAGFFDRVELPTNPEECWIWCGGTTHRYGTLRAGGESWRAHRFSWHIFRGAIPPGMSVCHKCDTPRCVNPWHMFLGTQVDNIHDMVAKGRQRGAVGEGNGRAILSWDKVQEIRNRHKAENIKQHRLAEMYGMSRQSISNIIGWKSWRKPG